ncbi:heme exporter protein CcmD [Alteromonas sp. C1M14]|uniref:heme exporter protein CcmD n=1 Tax=Alteromonas sp. C1M14 TaxID=2841567 RepID=UPI001C083623|nr:heme exporter protein CcmD [Alteromonas sp. C1M14]MBU2977818.1 heme exporter protein CcmD [Alteromonas sp. C1M14]
MQFDSLADFFAMGGYGFYVWLSFGVSALMMVAITVQTRMEHSKLLAQITTEKQRQVRIEKARKMKNVSHVR